MPNEISKYQIICQRLWIGKYFFQLLEMVKNLLYYYHGFFFVNRREKGVVPPVRSQGSCGACWAISVVDTISSISAIKRQQNFSELCLDQVINCAGNGNFGCEGGDTCRLLEWLKQENVKLNTLQQCQALESKNNGSTCVFQRSSTGDFLTLDRFACVRYVLCCSFPYVSLI